MQGAIGDSLPYWLDLVGYLYTEFAPDENNQNTVEVKKLWIGRHPQFEAGERVQGLLGSVVERPNITEMLAQILGESLPGRLVGPGTVNPATRQDKGEK